MKKEDIKVFVAGPEHEVYVDTILQTIADAAKVRGTGIAKRTHEYLATKMKEAKAVIALSGNRFAGFSYIETWGNKQYVTTSGLIVHPDFRGLGVAKKIKDMTFSLARTRWPHAKIFSLTSGAAVMKMNTELGYQPVTFADLTDDEAFWRGCEGCVNVDVLHRTGRKYCICTAMLYDPEEHLPAKIPEEVIERIKKLDSPPQPPLGGEKGMAFKFQTADPTLYTQLKEFAAQNRKNQTEAESILWSLLQKRQLRVPFRRQHIIGNYIADFACLPLKLIIEVDGGYHSLSEQQVNDAERTAWLESKGFTVLRFTNEEITSNTNNVINKIKEIIWKITSK
jgi:very-short-patch-repair endonuclease